MSEHTKRTTHSSPHPADPVRAVRVLPTIDTVNKRLDEWVAADRIDFSKLKAPEDEEEKKKQVAASTKTDKRDKKRKREGDDPAASAASAAEDTAAEVACTTALTLAWGLSTAPPYQLCFAFARRFQPGGPIAKKEEGLQRT